jgi:hypothetical protein
VTRVSPTPQAPTDGDGLLARRTLEYTSDTVPASQPATCDSWRSVENTREIEPIAYSDTDGSPVMQKALVDEKYSSYGLIGRLLLLSTTRPVTTGWRVSRRSCRWPATTRSGGRNGSIRRRRTVVRRARDAHDGVAVFPVEAPDWSVVVVSKDGSDLMRWALEECQVGSQSVERTEEPAERWPPTYVQGEYVGHTGYIRSGHVYVQLVASSVLDGRTFAVPVIASRLRVHGLSVDDTHAWALAYLSGPCKWGHLDQVQFVDDLSSMSRRDRRVVLAVLELSIVRVRPTAYVMWTFDNYSTMNVFRQCLRFDSLCNDVPVVLGLVSDPPTLSWPLAGPFPPQ